MDLKNLRQKILSKNIKISVVGQGYVGLSIASLFAKKGFAVYGFDISKEKIEKLKKGENHIIEEEWITPVVRELANSRMIFSEDPREAALCGDVMITAVPTPVKQGKTKLQYILSATDSIISNDISGKLLVFESTMPPGTTENILKPRIESKTDLVAGEDFGLAFSPERIDPGNKTHMLWNTPKVVGGINDASTELTALLYGQIVEKVVKVSSPTSAEMIKVMENTQRDVQIALTNLYAKIGEKLGIDIEESLDAAATKWNFVRLKPGCGVGGECIGDVDYMLIETAEELGVDADLLHSTRDLNESMPKFTVDKMINALKEKGKDPGSSRIAVLGLSYKGNSADLRNSPALEVVEELRKAGIKNFVTYDPFAKVSAVNQVTSLDDAISGTDCAVIATDHTIFGTLKWPEDMVVVDGRNMLNGQIAKENYYGLGRVKGFKKIVRYETTEKNAGKVDRK